MRSTFAAPRTLPFSLSCFFAFAPLLAAACGHVATGGLTPVPAVHHAARDVAELSILLRDDATVTATDPAVLARATQAQAGPRFRESMTRALEEAGFHVVRSTASAWDVEAKIRLEAVGSEPDMRQIYRLTLVAHDGKTADELVWEWPKETLVALDAVHDFASHHMANALGDSRRLADFAAATAPGRATAQRTGEGATASNGAPPSAPPGASAASAAGAAGAAFVAAAPQPAAYALIIGVEHYRDAPPPAGARADAEHFAALAKKTLGLKDDHVHVALDERATKTDIEEHLAWLESTVPAGGRVYFYFSGHGAPDTSNGSPYLLPYDANPRTVERTGIALASIMKSLGKTRAKDVLAIVDACFSGAGGRSVLPPGARPLVRVKEAPPVAQLALFTASSGSEISGPVAGLAAAGAGARAEGLFTHYLVEGLGTGIADTDGDGQVSLQELGDWVRPRVARDAKKDEREQHPAITVGTGVGAPASFIVAYGFANK